MVEIVLANCGGAYTLSSRVLLPPTTPKHSWGIIEAKGLIMGISLPGGFSCLITSLSGSSEVGYPSMVTLVTRQGDVKLAIKFVRLWNAFCFPWGDLGLPFGTLWGASGSQGAVPGVTLASLWLPWDSVGPFGAPWAPKGSLG